MVCEFVRGHTSHVNGRNGLQTICLIVKVFWEAILTVIMDRVTMNLHTIE